MDELDVKPIKILLVEDNEDDIFFIKKALKSNKIKNRLLIAKDGQTGIDMCIKHKPDLMLLDINLPGKNGIEVLQEIKNDPVLRKTIVVMLTSSELQKDVCNSYKFHANCYIIKPIKFPQLVEIVRQVGDLFLTVVKLPHKRD